MSTRTAPTRYAIEGVNEQNADISILAALCVFALFVLGVYLAVTLSPTSTSSEFGSFFTEIGRKTDTRFAMGDVKLGTKFQVLKRKHPEASVGVTTSGMTTLAYRMAGANYTVWYGKQGSDHIAFRARYDRTVMGSDIEAITASLSQQYGKPSASECNRRIVDGQRVCQFSWWSQDKVRVDLVTHDFTGAKSGRMDVTVQATDTRMEGRVRRAIASSPL